MKTNKNECMCHCHSMDCGTFSCLQKDCPRFNGCEHCQKEQPEQYEKLSTIKCPEHSLSLRYTDNKPHACPYCGMGLMEAITAVPQPPQPPRQHDDPRHRLVDRWEGRRD
jgi:hypothetical protein